jgi:hypothetical protein
MSNDVAPGFLVANWSAFPVCVVDAALMTEIATDATRIFSDQR